MRSLLYIVFMLPWLAALIIGIPSNSVVEPVSCVSYDPHHVILKDIMVNNVLCTFTSPGSNDEPINITNNNHSINVSYSEVLNFIKYDKTDELPYHDGFRCGEFATMVHDHAEKFGIKAHVVVVTYNDERPAHMINGFNTTDMGMIFFDCTGTTLGNTYLDKEVKLIENQESIERSVYSGLRVPGRPIKKFYIV